MPGVYAALFAIMGLVLVLPLSSKRVEEELELFLLAMGALAVTASGAWSAHLVAEALREPVKIAAAVLVFGFAFRAARQPLRRGVSRLARRLGMRPFLFLLVAVLGLASSVVTAIIAALALVEVVSALRLPKGQETRLTVVACFSIGLGAALTPLGEPLSTIAVAKLAGEPHQAGFWFLAGLLGAWVMPGVLVLSVLASVHGGDRVSREESLEEGGPRESGRSVAARAAKVYAFVAGLVLLAAGLAPLVDRFVLGQPRALLYWVNSISAVLDNATLAAAELSPQMERGELRFLLLGMLCSGGMLVPGNIPNIVCAQKLGIGARDWARYGVPLGAALMLAYFAALTVLG